MPSKLEQMQLQFRQKLKEEQMIRIHTDNQQKALSKISKYTAAPTAKSLPQSHHSPIKKGSPGVDRSRPLPPINKDKTISSHSSSGSNSSSSRSSPVDKVATAYSRSKSTDPVESRQKSNVVLQRNGYIKVEPRQQEEKKVSPELLNKLKQAELQRLKLATKIRDAETSPRNGISNQLFKPTLEQKKPSRPSAPISTSVTVKSISKTQPSLSTQRSPSTKPSSSPRCNNGSDQRKPPGPGQEQCVVCGRNFNQDRIEKHISICKKAAQKKVKVFDATKMRTKGTEAEQFVRKGVTTKAETKASKKADWRKKHNEFIETIRQAKMVQQHLANGGKVSDLPPPPPSDTSDYVPCPHCGRKFSEAVADRHIPKCKNILSNKKNHNASPRRR